MAEDVKVGDSSGDNYKTKTIKKSPCFQNLNKTIHYLTSNAKRVFILLRQMFTKALIF